MIFNYVDPQFHYTSNHFTILRVSIPPILLCIQPPKNGDKKHPQLFSRPGETDIANQSGRIGNREKHFIVCGVVRWTSNPPQPAMHSWRRMLRSPRLPSPDDCMRHDVENDRRRPSDMTVTNGNGTVPILFFSSRYQLDIAIVGPLQRIIRTLYAECLTRQNPDEFNSANNLQSKKEDAKVERVSRRVEVSSCHPPTLCTTHTNLSDEALQVCMVEVQG